MCWVESRLQEEGSKNKPEKGAPVLSPPERSSARPGDPEPKDEGEKQDKPGQGKRKNQGKAGAKRKADDACVRPSSIRAVAYDSQRGG